MMINIYSVMNPLRIPIRVSIFILISVMLQYIDEPGGKMNNNVVASIQKRGISLLHLMHRKMIMVANA